MDKMVRGALLSIGIGLIVGPIVAYSFTVLLYMLGIVSYLALREWGEPFIIGWCISIPAGALIGGLRLSYRTSLAIGSLCGLLFAYSLFGFFYWQSQGKLPYYPDFLWLSIVVLQGIVMASLIRWLSSKIDESLMIHRFPQEWLVNWLSIGTIIVLVILWGIGWRMYIASKPAKKVEAQFTAVKFHPDKIFQGDQVTFYVWVDSKEPIKSVYLIDSLRNVHMLRRSSQSGKNLLFVGELIPEKVGFQQFIVVLVTPSGSIEQRINLYVHPRR